MPVLSYHLIPSRRCIGLPYCDQASVGQQHQLKVLLPAHQVRQQQRLKLEGAGFQPVLCRRGTTWRCEKPKIFGRGEKAKKKIGKPILRMCAMKTCICGLFISYKLHGAILQRNAKQQRTYIYIYNIKVTKQRRGSTDCFFGVFSGPVWTFSVFVPNLRNVAFSDNRTKSWFLYEAKSSQICDMLVFNIESEILPNLGSVGFEMLLTKPNPREA